jgi:RNA exonuclease 4
MVEINNLTSGLARISVVNEHGDVIINTLCKPPGLISDYRYDITGLTADDLENAMEYEDCRKLVNIILIKDCPAIQK